MKRYWLFAGNIYYPGGGMNDIVADCDSIEECYIALRQELEDKESDIFLYDSEDVSRCWAHIFDTEKEEIIWKLTSEWFLEQKQLDEIGQGL